MSNNQRVHSFLSKPPSKHLQQPKLKPVEKKKKEKRKTKQSNSHMMGNDKLQHLAQQFPCAVRLETIWRSSAGGSETDSHDITWSYINAAEHTHTHSYIQSHEINNMYSQE